MASSESVEELLTMETNMQSLKNLTILPDLVTPELNSTNTNQQDEDAYADPSLKQRPASIFTAPTEVLLKIFLCTKGDSPGDTIDSFSLKQIQNIRLTCSRFHEISSHLLIPTLSVRPHLASLSRLESLSSHPLISRGVKVVRVGVAFYDYGIAFCKGEFAHAIGRRLEKRIKAIKRHREGEETAEMELVTPTGHKDLHEFQEYLQHIGYSDATARTRLGASHHLTMFAKMYHEYGARFKAQQDMLLDGSFVRAIAEAFKRMPTTTILDISDSDFSSMEESNDCLLGRAQFDEEAVLRSLLAPISWEDSDRVINKSISSLAFKLPIAIHQAGNSLLGIRYRLTPPFDPTVLGPSKEEVIALKAATQELKEFELLFESDVKKLNWPVQFGFGLNGIRDWVCAMVDTESLTKLSIVVESCRSTNLFLNFGRVLNLRPRHKLTSLKLYGVPIKLKSLETFTAGLQAPYPRMHLHYIHLLDRTWSDAFELLKGKFDEQSELRYVVGGECFVLTEAGNLFFFGEDNFAEAYARGERQVNILKKLLYEYAESSDDE